MNLKKLSLRTAAGTTLAGAALLTSAPALACGGNGDDYLGSICVTAANFCPANTHIAAAGQLVPISQYQALFSLLGTNYGGDGVTNFALPDLRGRSAVGAGRGPGLYPVPLGQRRGTETTTLTTDSLPTHNHGATFTPSGSGGGGRLDVSTASATEQTPTSETYLAAAAGKASIYSTDGTNTVPLKGLNVSGDSGSVSIDNTGGGQPFATIPPQLGMTYCIAHVGVYPSRN
ncbi:MAG: phage tail protein [Pseudomonadota bacterium]